MAAPTHGDAYQVLLLQAGGDGRDAALFGESFSRARSAPLPFMVGDAFPDVYLEFPLVGSPFLDVTVLYGRLAPGTRICSPAAGDADAVLDWYAGVSQGRDGLTLGFEMDTKEAELPESAIHFQPRHHTELVCPFFEALGEPERADLYLGLAERMPESWQPSFFGLFRGRPGSPLRVCGYLGEGERVACAGNPAHLRRVFDEIGFAAYDEALLEQAATLFACAPGSVDYQIDVYPDGILGPTFAFDVQFEIQRPEMVRASFETGPVADVMGLLESWGTADARWRLAADAAFARAIPLERDDGTMGAFAFSLMPQWAKVRWTNGVLQPSKLYLLASAGFLGDKKRVPSHPRRGLSRTFDLKRA